MGVSMGWEGCVGVGGVCLLGWEGCVCWDGRVVSVRMRGVC